MVEQILSNALKYTEDSGRIAVYAETETSGAGTSCAESESARAGTDGPRQKLIIEDSGIGIAPEDLARVFERGFTGYNGRQHKKSTGIGLYLCRRVMDRLSHTIEIESEPGRGTKVKIGLDRYQLKGD